MNIDEIRKNAPSGSTHYCESPINLGYDCITYFKCVKGKYYEYFSHHFARYESGCSKDLIKPL